MTRRKICVVTGSRADYGLLVWPMKLIAGDPELRLQVIVTGSHLAPEFDETHRVVESDGFAIDHKVEMLLSGDSPVAVTKSLGLGVIGFAEALRRLKPDILLLLGDRFEIFAAAQAALIARIPVAHLCGGDSTEGAFDEALRHSITKMSHIHLVTNELAARRVRQLGEDPARVHQVGSPGLDHLKNLQAMSREAFFADIGLTPRRKNLLITFHPATLDCGSSECGSSAEQLEELLQAIDGDWGLVLTGSNADTGGRSLGRRLKEFAATRDQASFHESLGQRLYFEALRHVDVVVGNSSSGLYEAPSFKTPTVNIGNRQKGRLKATSVIDCPPECQAIRSAIERAFELDCREVVNPYGDGESAPRIVAALKAAPPPSMLLQKHFRMMEAAG